MKVSIVVQFHNGIGHLARVSAIAKELARFSDVTIFSGGRPVDFRLGDSIRFVQLPAMRWNPEVGANLLPVDPDLSADECISERSRILVEAYTNDRPDVVITEFFPFTPGFYGSTLDALIEAINCSTPRPLLLCSIRAFPRVTYLDSDVSPDWIRQRLLKDYDGVLHHVDPAIFPLSSLGSYLTEALRGVPVHQTGFVRKPIVAPTKTDGKGILLTVGGGNAKSASLLMKWFEGVRLLPKRLYPVHAVCGPLMSIEDKAKVRASAGEGVILHDTVPNLDALMLECEAVVCMGGYNTLVEALSLHKPVLAFASGIHEDQHVQIARYADSGLLVEGNAGWTPREIADAMESLIDFSPRHDILTSGATKTAEILNEIWLEKKTRDPRVVF